jgi:hypothetical protein
MKQAMKAQFLKHVFAFHWCRGFRSNANQARKFAETIAELTPLGISPIHAFFAAFIYVMTDGAGMLRWRPMSVTV